MDVFCSIHLKMLKLASHPLYLLGKGWGDTTDLKLDENTGEQDYKPVTQLFQKHRLIY